LSDDDVGIRGGSVGPLRRNRANRAVIDAQQQPLAEPIIAFTDADKLPSGDRMKRMVTRTSCAEAAEKAAFVPELLGVKR